jgi:prepilin-type processing-associated H-X9-DG protein
MDYIVTIIALIIWVSIICSCAIFFYRSICSFIRKEFIRGSGQLLLSAALALIVLAPILTSACWGHPREKAIRCTCANNIKTIVLFIKMYANDNNEAHPVTFNELVCSNYARQGDLPAFICPSCSKSGGRSAIGAATNIHAWTSYAYVSGLTENDPISGVQSFCVPDNHEGEGANVGFAGGHVIWYPCKTQTDPAGKRNLTFQELMSTPSLFYGTTNESQLAELKERTRIIYPTRRR